MTTLLSWTGVDTHGPGSIYIAGDSRISWGTGNYWDVGRKVFASKTQPEIFGYSGAVTLPIQILGQIVDIVDARQLFFSEDAFETKLEKVRAAVERSYLGTPSSKREDAELFYATRIGSGLKASFHAAKVEIVKGQVTSKSFELPRKSGLIAVGGSGKTELKSWHQKWTGDEHKDPFQSGSTSRNVFSAFCDSLQAGGDKFSGGAPQLVGIYRKGPAIPFGVIQNKKRYLHGIEVDAGPHTNDIEWRNTLFERCCGNAMELLKGAQRQPRSWTIN